MNTATGHVVADFAKVPEAERGNYTLLPGWLRRIAEERLKGQQETTIDTNADTPLAAWARAKVATAQAKDEMRRAKRLAAKAKGGFHE